MSAGQYFDIKIDYVDITEEEFNNRMANYKAELSRQFAESHRLEQEIMKQLDALHFNVNVGSNGHRLEEEIMKQLDALHFNVNVGNNE